MATFAPIRREVYEQLELADTTQMSTEQLREAANQLGIPNSERLSVPQLRLHVGETLAAIRRHLLIREKKLTPGKRVLLEGTQTTGIIHSISPDGQIRLYGMRGAFHPVSVKPLI